MILAQAAHWSWGTACCQTGKAGCIRPAAKPRRQVQPPATATVKPRGKRLFKPTDVPAPLPAPVWSLHCWSAEKEKSRRVSIHPQVRARKTPADTNHKLARAKSIATNEEHLGTKTPPPVQPVEERKPSLSPTSQTRLALPVLQEGQDHGADHIIDWSDENIDAIAAVEGMLHPPGLRPAWFLQLQHVGWFIQLQGSRDLFQKDIPLYNNQEGLYDEAHNTWNSSRIRAGESRGQDFLALSFEFSETYVKEQLLFSCSYSLLSELNDWEGSERDENGQQWWFPNSWLTTSIWCLSSSSHWDRPGTTQSCTTIVEGSLSSRFKWRRHLRQRAPPRQTSFQNCSRLPHQEAQHPDALRKQTKASVPR